MYFIVPLVKLTFQLIRLVFNLFIARPAVALGIKILTKFNMRKNTLGFYTLGLSALLIMLTGVQLFASITPILWIVAIVIMLMGFCIFTIEEDEEFIEEVEYLKEQKKLEKKQAKEEVQYADWEFSEDDEEEKSRYTYEQVVKLVETAMSGSKLYPQEDYEKRPDFYLSDYYTINRVEPDGEVDITFKSYSGADMVKTSEDMSKNFPNVLASVFQYETAVEYKEPGQPQGVFNLTLYPSKPDTGEIDFVNDFFPHTDEIWEDTDFYGKGVPYAVDTFGQRLYYQPYENHAFAGGSSGGGKSVWARNIVIGACKSNAIIVGFDLKQGVELAPFADRLTAFATTPAQAVVLLEALVRVMNIRYAVAQERGWEKIPFDSKEFPNVTIVIDEIAQLTDVTYYPTKELKDEYWTPIMDSLGKLYTLARAANMTIIAMTQSPKATIFNTNMRNNITSSYGLRTKDNTQLVTIIGPEGDNVPPISSDEVGAGYGVGKGFGNSVVKFKTYFIDSNRLKQLIKDTAHLKPDVRANDEYNTWKLLGEFEQTQWEGYLNTWLDQERISENAYTALIDAKTLTSIKHKLTEKEISLIVKSFIDATPAGKFIGNRFSFDDLNEFAGTD